MFLINDRALGLVLQRKKSSHGEVLKHLFKDWFALAASLINNAHFEWSLLEK